MSDPQLNINATRASQSRGGVRLSMILGAVLFLALICFALLYMFVY